MVSVIGLDGKNCFISSETTNFGIFFDFYTPEHFGLVYTLSQGAVLPIRSNLYFLDI